MATFQSSPQVPKCRSDFGFRPCEGARQRAYPSSKIMFYSLMGQEERVPDPWSVSHWIIGAERSTEPSEDSLVKHCEGAMLDLTFRG